MSTTAKNPEPRPANPNQHPSLGHHGGAHLTFGLTDEQLRLIRTNNGFAGGGAMTTDGQGAGGAGR